MLLHHSRAYANSYNSFLIATLILHGVFITGVFGPRRTYVSEKELQTALFGTMTSLHVDDRFPK